MPTDKFIAVIKSSAVRDTQVCMQPDCDPLDDDTWYDKANAEIYLGVFCGPNASAEAAKSALTDPENIRLIPLTAL